MKLRKLMVAVFAFFAGLAQAQQMPPIPADPDVVVGKLDNGLTYYIRHNNWPENRADFYIAQKVGAIQEEESQRGLAHFLEHMCFNGTKHFPGNGVIRYCESIGVQFGRDLNAYTSIDATVYYARLVERPHPRPDRNRRGARRYPRGVAYAHIGFKPHVRAQPAEALPGL